VEIEKKLVTTVKTTPIWDPNMIYCERKSSAFSELNNFERKKLLIHEKASFLTAEVRLSPSN
jgi:hypothetical protein